jgi:UDP-3-O-[3-hydroxymyristoyl] N-acetylglucosamine deacetylase
VIDAPISIEDGDRRIAVHPAEAFGIDVTIDFAHPAIGRQRISCDGVTPEWFAREIAPARTFGFVADVDALRARGLARGASLENTIVFDDTGIMNEDGLRFSDECVRHKALDLIGDLALLGAPLRGRVEVVRGGHVLHHRLVMAILESVNRAEC